MHANFSKQIVFLNIKLNLFSSDSKIYHFTIKVKNSHNIGSIIIIVASSKIYERSKDLNNSQFSQKLDFIKCS